MFIRLDAAAVGRYTILVLGYCKSMKRGHSGIGLRIVGQQLTGTLK